MNRYVWLLFIAKGHSKKLYYIAASEYLVLAKQKELGETNPDWKTSTETWICYV